METAISTAVQGFTAQGFEPVTEAFAANFDPSQSCPEVGAAFCVVHRDRVVVDVWAGFADRARTRPWQRDTVVTTFSTTKGITALCISLLESRGLIDYHKPVAHYWPEFAANGKAGVDVATMLSHRSGLSGLRTPLEMTDLYDREAIVAKLAAAKPLWTPGPQAGYHAWSWGFLAGELIRRVTGGVSLPQILRQELGEKLNAEYHIGISESTFNRVADTLPPLKPPVQTQAEMSEIVELTLLNPRIEAEIANDRAFQQAELAAMNGVGSANGIARLYAPFANRGLFEGIQVVDESAFERACEVNFAGVDMNLGKEVRWGAAGFFGNTATHWYGPNQSAFGHSGWGGSMGFADPKAQVSVGYTPNQMDVELNGDPRGLRLVEALYACLPKS